MKIVKLTPSLAVKYGHHVKIAEAKHMLFVAGHVEKPTLPPKVYAYYTFGPFGRDLDDYGSDYDTYIFMDLIEGQSLDKAWESYDQSTKESVAAQLNDFVSGLRRLELPMAEGQPYIGGVNRTPIVDQILDTYEYKGNKLISNLCIKC